MGGYNNSEKRSACVLTVNLCADGSRENRSAQLLFVVVGRPRLLLMFYDLFIRLFLARDRILLIGQ